MEKKQRYSNAVLAELHENLLFQCEQGNPIDYEIRIDHLTAVKRTNDPGKFFDFEQLLKESSNELMVLLYKGASRVCDKYIMQMGEGDQEKGGFTHEQVEELIRKEKIEFYTKMEISHLRDKIKDQKRIIKELTRGLATAGSGNTERISQVLKDLAGSPLLKNFFNDSKAVLAGHDQAVGTDQGVKDEDILSLLTHYHQQLGEEVFQSLLGTTLTMAQNPDLIAKVREFISHQQEKS